MIEKARSAGVGGQAVPLDDRTCAYLVAVAVRDLGLQVDCIRDQKAYEFKIRVTIASSGQGRWQEELEFPADARSSNYMPVLVVLDATPNPKLAQLEAAFVDARGEVYKGAAAWAHLDDVAGPTMAVFLEKYVRGPMQSLLVAAPHELPDFQAKMHGQSITLYIGGESLHIKRQPTQEVDDQSDDLPDDANDGIPGP